MNVKQAAENTLSLWSKAQKSIPEPEQTTHGTTEAHVRYVLEQLMDGQVNGEKAHRWLGWAQGWLVARDKITLDDCKYANVLS